LSTGCTVHKYVDNTTLSELVQAKNMKTKMPSFLANILDWSTDSDMQISASKTKEVILGPLSEIIIP